MSANKNTNRFKKYFLVFTISLSVIIIGVYLGQNHLQLEKQGIFQKQIQKSSPGPDQRPAEWGWIQRSFPYYTADKNAYRDAIKQAHVLRAMPKKNSAVQWVFAGPDNIGGRIVDIEFNPQYPSIVYAAAATGGVFKSQDTGVTWQPVFDDQAVLTIGDICIDPVNPDIIYVGTGEANGGHNNFPGGGVYKSMDAGQTWECIGLENSASIGRILINPRYPDSIFVAAVGSYFAPNPERGVYVSPDGGNSWEQSLFVTDSTGAIDIVMDPENPDFMLAAMWERVRRPVYSNQTHLYGKTSGVYRTKNSGKSWELLGPATGLPDANSVDVGRIGLSMYQANSDIIYALYNDGSNIISLYRTGNGGDTWQDADPNKIIRKGTGGFSWYFGQVRVHPQNPDIVFALDVAFMRSNDGGLSWPVQYGYYDGYPGLHVDHHALAFHPQNSNYIICGNDGGINISENGGDNWTKVASLPVTQFYEIGLDYTNPERLYGGTQDNGTLCTKTGLTDDWERILGGDGFYVIVDPNNPDIIYAEYQFGSLFKSINGGSSWQNILNNDMGYEKTNWSTPVAMDPNNSNTLYYGTYRLWRTENGTESWSPVSPDLTMGLEDSRVGTITTIAVAPTNSNIIYVGTDDSQVWVSSNYGGDWTLVSDSLPFRWVTRVVVDPTDENTAYVTFSGLRWKDPQPHVFRTTDMGNSWEDISANLPDAPVNAFAVDPIHREVLYLGSDIGVFVSFNSGGSWQALGEALPVVVINDMKIHESAYKLIVGTHGRSMYKIDLNLVNTIKETDEPELLAKQFSLEQNYPNPFNSSTVFKYKLGSQSHVQIRIFDELGRTLRLLLDKQMGKGIHPQHWDGKNEAGKNAASGVYYYQIEVRGKYNYNQTKKMLLIK